MRLHRGRVGGVDPYGSSEARRVSLMSGATWRVQARLDEHEGTTESAARRRAMPIGNQAESGFRKPSRVGHETGDVIAHSS
jgi:hypothetical protein